MQYTLEQALEELGRAESAIDWAGELWKLPANTGIGPIRAASVAAQKRFTGPMDKAILITATVDELIRRGLNAVQS